ncbi:MAG TPA: hypothetical protein VM327_08375 [Candidatus Thermoplasmatota archaeon]|nr:hypothetical protein [Candidatus Thermoplasmatota archaeon]
MAQDTARTAVGLEAWSSFVKASLGALGLALLAVGPLLPQDEAFHYLPQYAFAIGAAFVLVAATMRLRSMLIVLGCLALTAGLTCTLVGGGEPRLNLAALALYCAAAVVLGAAGRHIWMAVPFLLVPLLVVAPQGPGWEASREAFSQSWERALGGPYPLAGLPAALAVVGAVAGQLRVAKWVPVRPSPVPLLLLAAGLVMASLVVGSLLPDPLATVRTVCWRVALISAVLGWVGLAYQIGRLAFIWEAAAACLLFVAGALLLDRATQLHDAVGPTLAITVATSLVPAALAGVGLVARRWIGSERPATAQPTAQLRRWDDAERSAFYTAATTAPSASGQAAAPTEGKPEAGAPAQTEEPTTPAKPDISDKSA